jgi:hypothetical protein
METVWSSQGYQYVILIVTRVVVILRGCLFVMEEKMEDPGAMSYLES